MITVKYDGGVVFLNEEYYAKVEYDQEDGRVTALPISCNIPRETIFDVKAVGYSNEAQPTSLLFENRSALACSDKEGDDTSNLVDGVYIVYKNGEYKLFREDLPREDGMRVGICWYGHRWLIGTDYGDVKWSEASVEELEANQYGIMEECEVVLDWDYMKARNKLIGLWKHIPFKDDETMPTAPMVLVQEHLAKHGCLNDALTFCGMPEYEVGISRWFAERYNAYHARFFGGNTGNLTGYDIYGAFRTQAVTLWR